MKVFSEGSLQKIRKVWSVRGLEFFKMYSTLKLYLDTPELTTPDGGFLEQFKAASMFIHQHLSDEDNAKNFHRNQQRMFQLLKALDHNEGDVSISIQNRISQLYIEMIHIASHDKGLYLKSTVRGTPAWALFSVMTKSEMELERLKVTDPEYYDALMEKKVLNLVIDEAVAKKVVSSGYTHTKKSILGRPVHVATDPNSGEEYIFETDGSERVLPVDEWILKEKRQSKALDTLSKVFPGEEFVGGLRKANDVDIERALTHQQVSYVALTDDAVKATAVTRIYPTVTINGEQVISGGRFKGLLLPDVVNRVGRMIEGVAYDYNPKLGRPVPLESSSSGSFKVTVSREPYVTVNTDGRLYLAMPSSGSFTALRKAMSALSATMGDVIKVPNTRNGVFLFNPPSFAAIRETLGSLTLSTSAAKKIEGYFKKLAKHDLATSKDNLGDFTADAIGGFKPGFELNTKQKQGLAWITSRKGNGTIAMDMGVGKTATSIAYMQAIKKQDFEEGDKFLFVCPSALKGNLPKEINAFVEDPDSLMNSVDVMSYDNYLTKMTADGTFMDNYKAVIFDEAQEMRNTASKIYKAAVVPHPRKVLLTGTPMERSPKDAFILASIPNNEDLSKAVGQRKLKLFEKEYCNVIGGRVVGIKQDPQAQKDLKTWVKTNMYYAAKTDVEEISLPKLTKETTVVAMHPDIEAMYRETTSGISEILEGMVDKYKDKDPKAINKAIETARFKLSRQFKKLSDLANLPEKFVPGIRNPKIDTAANILASGIESGSRAVLFTDSPELAVKSAMELSKMFPATKHAVCLSSSIEIYRNGKTLQTYTEKAYVAPDGSNIPKSRWKTFVIETYIKPVETGVKSATLTAPYIKGQNLQTFNVNIHLDRDSWNAGNISQRDARTHRTGQPSSVKSFTIDAVYEDPQGDKDVTLDEIRKYVQLMEEELFNEVIVKSQTEALGAEWFGMRKLKSGFFKTQKDLALLAMSPYVKRYSGLTDETINRS